MFCCCPKLVNFLFAMMLGAIVFAAGGMFAKRNAPSTPDAPNGLMPAAFHYDGTSRSKTITVATGWIDDTVEGIFVLDHLTGDLQCWVLNARSGEVGAIYRGNVVEALGNQGKADPDYVMVTGRMDFSNFRKGNLRYASCVCYVGESSSDKIIGYSFSYDPSSGARGKTQGGVLEVVATFPFRNQSLIRD